MQTPQGFVKGSSQGFTLIELIVVIAIIGILAAIFAPSAISTYYEQKLRSAQRELESALRLAQSSSKRYGETWGVTIDATTPLTMRVAPVNAGAVDMSDCTRKPCQTILLDSSVRVISNTFAGGIARFNGYGEISDAVNRNITLGSSLNGLPEYCVLTTSIFGGFRSRSSPDC